jgi:IS1 family transposase
MNDLLIDEVYSKQRGRRVEFVGIQLDEMWGLVGNKDNKQWLWLVLDPQNRQVVAFHVGGVRSKMPSYFTRRYLLLLKEMSPFSLITGKPM